MVPTLINSAVQDRQLLADCTRCSVRCSDDNVFAVARERVNKM